VNVSPTGACFAANSLRSFAGLSGSVSNS